ncbi:MAG: aminotransferase [Paracoccaceae bacterium]|nr:aminotransferase [Paracoccaceae bacterium]
MADTQQIWKADRDHNLHPWTHFDSFDRDGPQLVVSKGSGCRLTDSNGKSYLDAVGGLWCTNIGLGRAEMAEAIAEQVRTLAYASTFVDMANEPAALLAARLADLAPAGLDHVQFTTGGSTAIDCAFRLVQFFQSCAGRPEKVHVVARQDSYHGSTYAAMSIGRRSGDRSPEFRYITEGIHHLSAPNRYRRPPDVSVSGLTDFLVDEFETLIARVGPERIGAFFAEPVMGSGGVIVPPDDYLQRMRQVCRRHDILFVADEVVTGFGRLGHWFASEGEFGVVPDVICCAKGLSSGYLPIGAVIFSNPMYTTMASGDPDRWFTNGLTYSGHPVCCRAALKNIEIIEREDLLGNAAEVGAYFEARLQDLKDLPTVGDIRGRKLMMCVESVRDKGSRELFPESVNIGKRISDACENRGLIVRPVGHLNVMSPPLVITRDEVDFIADTLSAALRQVADDLTRERLW